MGRFVNDRVGADENALMKRIVVDGSPHLVLFARRDIYLGDENRYDYGDASRNPPWRKRPLTEEKKILMADEFVMDIEENDKDIMKFEITKLQPIWDLLIDKECNVPYCNVNKLLTSLNL
ncbi:Hypothetical predicted protein [Mytilus galloprovincialis]|uniref:SET domain-containing protein n=1 Tax=Mytilus galloprovincialis TaxID=29158 RepID=A0A8B6FT78_MYTGA|nr:Hypothetical predicted protein [Mytilus galloprovincialis]